MRTMERLTPRERWFWIGAGFACGFFVLFALTVILIGVFFARFLPVRGPTSPIVAQPGAPSLHRKTAAAVTPPVEAPLAVPRADLRSFHEAQDGATARRLGPGRREIAAG